jgi:hypothetical protein
LTAQRIAIFGATSGIATEVARLYAAAGATLVLVGRDRQALGGLAADLGVRGAADVKVVCGDLTAVKTVSGLVADAWQAAAGLDLALVAHGSLPIQTEVQDDPAALAEAMNVNFSSAAAVCAALSPFFEAAGSGTLAVITSVAGDRGRQSNYVYGAAKGGLQRFLEGLRHRLYRSGVQVLDIRPGFVATRMTAHLSTSGPLWATPQRVAADIVRAVDKKRSVLYTPPFWRLIMLVVRTLPAAVFHRSKL